MGLGLGDDLRAKSLVPGAEKVTAVNRWSDMAFQNRNFAGINNTSAGEDSFHAEQVRDNIYSMQTGSSPAEKILFAGYGQMNQVVSRAGSINQQTTGNGYSGGFGSDLQQAAKLIKWKEATGQGGSTVVYLETGGWDTHSNIINAIPLTNLANNLSAFWSDLNSISGVGARTVINIVSEFSRTTSENGGQGTDHAHAGTAITFGGAVSGGVWGDAPALSEIQGTNRMPGKYSHNEIRKEILDWLGVPSHAVFPDEVLGANMGLLI
jgi:uncharacterized protein (DUF1501 family)